MGFTAIPVGAPGRISARLPVGDGTGGLAVIVALVAILGAFYLLRTREVPGHEVRSTLIAVAIPLALTFATAVVFDAFVTLS